MPLIAAALAILAADRVVRQRWLTLVATLAGLLTLALFTQRLSTQLNWSASARIVAELVRACPATAVHTPIEWSRDFTNDGPDYASVMRYGYKSVGRQFGFSVEPATSRRVDPNCPTVVWGEHYHQGSPDAVHAVSGLPVAPAAIATATVLRTRSGFVPVYRPPFGRKSPLQ